MLCGISQHIITHTKTLYWFEENESVVSSKDISANSARLRQVKCAFLCFRLQSF